MNKLKLSPWHDCNVKPVHIGVYQRFYDEGTPDEDIVYCFWDGRGWKTYGDSIIEALTSVAYSGAEERWRGVLK